MGMNDQTWDESLLRSVAVLQTQCRLLDEQADILADLSDMQAHRRIKSELADYIAAHAKVGTIPSDPLAEIKDRLLKLSMFFSEVKEFTLASQEEPWQYFLNKKIPSVSLNKISQAQDQLEESANQLPARLQIVAVGLSPLDWDSDDDNADIHPELVICAYGLAEELDGYLPEEAELRRSLRLLALGKGHHYKEVRFYFEKVRERLSQLVETHAQHREALKQIAEPISLGNYRSAGQIMANGGMEQNFSDGFTDLDYGPAKISAELQIAANAAVSFASRFSGDCNEILQGFEKVDGKNEQTYLAKAKTQLTAWRNILDKHDCSNAMGTIGNKLKRSFEKMTGKDKQSHLSKAKAQLVIWRNILDEHWAHTTGIAGSELEQECRPHLEAAYQWLDWVGSELDAKAAKAAKKRLLKIFAVSTAMLLVLIGIAIGISAYKKHKMHVAAAYATNVLAPAQAEYSQIHKVFMEAKQQQEAFWARTKDMQSYSGDYFSMLERLDKACREAEAKDRGCLQKIRQLEENRP